ncbi:MAG TPA: hypothetical protein VFI65_03450 [Streptosporangiaceae bacterium]|nr:hypothetical protein [Streptosporangiaceae bacterium]
MSKPDHAGELVEFGGYGRRPRSSDKAGPVRKLAGRVLRLVREATLEVTLGALVVGLVAGFVGGRVSAHHAHPTAAKKVTSSARSRGPFDATPVIFTGNSCGVQRGMDLQLGIEIMNQSTKAVTLGEVLPTFPLGGLHLITSGLGTCGEIPFASPFAKPVLGPGMTGWVTATVSVKVRCPQPLPVGFMVSYAQSGRSSATVLNGFPDLSQVAYRNCPYAGPTARGTMTITQSGTAVTVESGQGSSYSR